MKLELKHICGYLPYGLKAITTCFSYENPSVGVIDYWSIHGNVENEISILADHGYYLCEIKDCKPILRPMSDLYKEVDGVVHIVELAKIHDHTNKWELKGYHAVQRDFNNYTFTYDGDFYCTDGSEYITVNNQLDLFNYLFEHHFDIYGLIDKGLAIDINTIK